MKNNYARGIMFIIFAGFFFSLMTLFVRLSGDLPTMEKAFFRNAVAAVVSIVILARSPQKFYIRRDSWFDLFMRAACGTIGLVCNFYAVDKLGLADANLLNKLSPFFAIIFSVFILKEVAGLMDWFFVALAFVGAAFVIKPSLNITSVYGVIGMMGGLGAGIAYTFVRRLGGKGERGPVIVMFFSVFSTLTTLPLMLINFKPMELWQLGTLLLAGCAAMGGQLCITKAYTCAPAKEISVFDYSQIIFAAILGWLFLNELPDVYSFIGYAIILCATVAKWARGSSLVSRKRGEN